MKNKLNNTHEYILNLKEPVTVNELKPLIGEKFPVLRMKFEWQKEVINTDYMEITKIKFPIDVGTEKSDGVVMIYSNYYLKGILRYNAWTGIKGIQKSIKCYLDTNS